MFKLTGGFSIGFKRIPALDDGNKTEYSRVNSEGRMNVPMGRPLGWFFLKKFKTMIAR